MAAIPWFWRYSALVSQRTAARSRHASPQRPRMRSLPTPKPPISFVEPGLTLLPDAPRVFLAPEKARALLGLFPSASVAQKPPLSRDEVGLFRALVDATREFGESVSLVEHFFLNDSVEQLVAHGWLTSYVYLCQQAKIYTPEVGRVAEAAVGVAMGAGLGAVSGGPIGFFVGLIKGVAGLVVAAIEKATNRSKQARISDEANRQIFYHLGPPPAVIDDWLVNWHAFQTARGLNSPTMRGQRTGEQNALWRRWESGHKLEYGCLGLLQYIRERLVTFPPLEKAQIQKLSTLWTLPGHPVQFFDLPYMIDGPPWLRGVGDDPNDVYWKRREQEGASLVEFYLRSGQTSMLSGQVVTPILPPAKADLQRLAQLQHAIGIAR